jgi:hypothetical protein
MAAFSMWVIILSNILAPGFWRIYIVKAEKTAATKAIILICENHAARLSAA